jgi:hypothetical protein
VGVISAESAISRRRIFLARLVLERVLRKEAVDSKPWRFSVKLEEFAGWEDGFGDGGADGEHGLVDNLT